ncbi:MAG: RNA-binding domain-containing protein, partial [Methanosarcinales archaeon]
MNLVEFKESFGKETIETIGAFANTKGGIVLIGVSDNGTIHGVQLSRETLVNWANQISQSTEPTVIPDIDTIQVDGKTIVIIRIDEFPIKPVSVRGRCFKRVKNSNRLMTPKGIAEMHLYTTGRSWDALPVDDASMDDIDFEKVREYIKKANATGRRKINKTEDEHTVLEKLELIKDGKPTWASILLFGKNPQRFCILATIHCGRFKTDTIIVDDRMIEGTILEQIDEAMDFIRKNINVKFVITGRPQREEIWDYPLDALREAVINAVCHRDYTDSSDIQIRIYDDQLMVWSPSPLPFGISLEDLRKPHKSVPRNKLIASVFFDLGLIEKWGSGIKRMIDECKKAGLPEPELVEYQGFRVIFRKDIYTEEYM